MATGNPLVIRGLTATGWNTVDQTVKDARVFSISPAVPVYHDSQQGAQRNRNSIFVIEVDGLRIAHLGDLGHVLDAAALNALGKLDVVLVPVGGVFTLDAPGATQVIGQLGSRIAVPMHYKTPRMQANWPGAGVEPFLAGKRVERPGSATLKLSRASLPSETTVVLLNYE
jgi:L-ascorbate metabolism protein UlaG (beta-lactamase superfamily)